ncbi:MAG: hypothetical protein CMI30_08635 [Opitutae bacterium]|nr:hypothetical protein [Opitutae bacterium]
MNPQQRIHWGSFMFHKFFQWRHRRRRKNDNPALRGVSKRTAISDLTQYVKEFGGTKTKAAGTKARILRKILRLTLFGVLLALTVWFVIESYKGLRLFD